MMKSKKLAIILGVIIVVLLAVDAVAAVMFLQMKNDKSQQVISLFEDEKYSQAYDEYIDAYGRGNSDKTLEEFLYNRILDIEEAFSDGDISYETAMDELDTIKKMRIMSLSDEISDVAKSIESLNSKDSVTTTKAEKESKAEESTTENAATTTEKITVEVTTRNYADGTTQSYLPTEPIPPERVSSTPRISHASTLNGKVLSSSNVNKNRSFTAEKAIDGYYDSCWCVSTKSNGGAGARIRFDLAEKSYVRGITMINGNLYRPQEDIYSLNGQIKNFTLTFSDGTKKSFSASYNGNASSNYQYFDFNEEIATDYIILTVDSGYAGTLYTSNVCLGEFGVY